MKADTTIKDLPLGAKFKLYWNSTNHLKKITNMSCGINEVNCYNLNSKSCVYCDPTWKVWRVK